MKTLELKDVSVRFGKVQALSGVSVSVEAGQVVMLVGPNGAGKSTFMRVLLGLARPSSGQLLIDRQPRAIDNALKARIGYLPENVAFSDNLTGLQVLRFFARARGVNRARIGPVLDRVGLTHAAGRAVRGYSRGMRQRLGLAACLASEPDLLVLDEPTGGLDQEGLAVFWSVLTEWREKGRMVVLSAHDLALLERRVDHMCVLRSGRLVASDTPAELRRTADLPHTVRFELAADAEEQTRGLCAAAEGLGKAAVERQGQWLVVRIPPDGLLSLMDLRVDFPRAVVGLRVEEPPLDLVYDRLLEAA